MQLLRPIPPAPQVQREDRDGGRQVQGDEQVNGDHDLVSFGEVAAVGGLARDVRVVHDGGHEVRARHADAARDVLDRHERVEGHDEQQEHRRQELDQAALQGPHQEHVELEAGERHGGVGQRGVEVAQHLGLEPEVLVGKAGYCDTVPDPDILRVDRQPEVGNGPLWVFKHHLQSVVLKWVVPGIDREIEPSLDPVLRRHVADLRKPAPDALP
mmetsp:Transcript_55584/g.146342  ORF Transcript_55584/g.146342 Transcript_55584/m.146342 type:complete len:213 (-) Transcript_55584:550-1188(-)